MNDWSRELTEPRRRMNDRIYESEFATQRWRQRADGQGAGLDAAVFSDLVARCLGDG
jgi:hypothetical protein